MTLKHSYISLLFPAGLSDGAGHMHPSIQGCFRVKNADLSLDDI